MKKSIYLLFVAVFFIGCSDDGTTPTKDDKTGNTSNGVEGTWNFASLSQENGEIKVNGTVFSTFSSTSSDEDGTFDFNSDGTIVSNVSYTSTVTTVTAGIPQDQTASIPATTTKGTYVYDADANTITTTPEIGETTVMKIEELTDTKMVTRQLFSTSTTQNGITSETSGEAVLTLTK